MTRRDSKPLTIPWRCVAVTLPSVAPPTGPCRSRLPRDQQKRCRRRASMRRRIVPYTRTFSLRSPSGKSVTATPAARRRSTPHLRFNEYTPFSGAAPKGKPRHGCKRGGVPARATRRLGSWATKSGAGRRGNASGSRRVPLISTRSQNTEGDPRAESIPRPNIAWAFVPLEAKITNAEWTGEILQRRSRVRFHLA
jgi:hypothetical protein